MYRLTKITLLAAFEAGAELLPGADEAGLCALVDGLAEQLRDAGALTAASEYDSAEVKLPEDADEGDALAERFPEDALPVGPVPGVRVLGRNGTFKKARLERKGNDIQLWLGTPKERYPLVSFRAQETE